MIDFELIFDFDSDSDILIQKIRGVHTSFKIEVGRLYIKKTYFR